jgi:hypothetical protein
MNLAADRGALATIAHDTPIGIMPKPSLSREGLGKFPDLARHGSRRFPSRRFCR